MRVSDSLTYDIARTGVLEARSRNEEAMRLATTGLRVGQPGDDPAAAALMVTTQADQKHYDSIQSVAQLASDELASADSAFGSLQNFLTRAQQLAVQFSNGNYSASDRASAATEVDGLLQSSVAALNVRVGDRYILGGNVDSAPPFDASGAYHGDAAQRQVEIAPGVTVKSSVRADVAVKGAGGGTDVLATIQALSTALKANDPDAVAATLAGLSAGISQVGAARSQAGVSMNSFDSAVAAAKQARDDATARTSQLGDADPIKAASQLASTQHALEASLTATAQGFKLTLLDYLR
ncbi:flagellin N-terminal helical domain-containing protein [Anaeromyxobacter paludicola]|uniref:Flagellin n=1 Tax=Anaeromyxobacter paludicola TaxID=2918171 RepID=A0ABN6N790_9BACT|nr:flagellin [Anaeromyxobacter paludicola]BDG08013.1 flagellar hook-associated protein 3 [Anaeromyxobacter paludicola]